MSANLNNRLTVLAGEIMDAVAGIRRDAQSMAEHALRAGHALAEAKASMPHGAWENWLNDHVQMSHRTARRYMQLAASGMETATVAEMGMRAATEALAAPRPTPAPPIPDQMARELAELLVKNMSDAEVERVTDWAARASEKYPDASVAEVMARETSLAHLLRLWGKAQEPARRRFIEWLRDFKEGLADG
jgi:hypothetical protein